MPTYVGIGGALHDTSIAALIDGQFRYRKSERWFSEKHHGAKDEFYASTLKDWGVSRIDRQCYTDRGRQGVSRKPYHGEEYVDEGKTTCLDHHIAHRYSTLDTVEQHAVFDGWGSGRNATRRYTGLRDIDGTVERFSVLGVGKFLAYLGRVLGFEGTEVDFPGKIMGLQAYGTADLELARQINGDTILAFLEPWFYDRPSPRDPRFQDAVATVHKACELIQVKYFEAFDHTRPIACSGGVMLNTVINSQLRKRYTLSILPHVYDGGLSIGCLNWMVRDLQIPGFPFVQDDTAPPDEPTDATIENVAELLARGKIVGWYQGHGEIGPRALGNRSILMSPTVKNGKDILNERVKKREWWRPFGASVLKEKALTYFDSDDNPYMLYNSRVMVGGLDSITHIDGTCRHQTVTREQTHYYRLIEKFEERTGLPLLLNTSQNFGGRPISSHPSQAYELYENSGMDALCCGNSLLSKG